MNRPNLTIGESWKCVPVLTSGQVRAIKNFNGLYPELTLNEFCNLISPSPNTEIVMSLSIKCEKCGEIILRHCTPTGTFNAPHICKKESLSA